MSELEVSPKAYCSGDMCRGHDQSVPTGREDAWSDTPEDLIEAALGLLCNVDEGNWRACPPRGQTPEWSEAAQRWLARYHRVNGGAQ